MVGRQARRDEFLEQVWAWTTQRTTEEIVQLASLLRIPVAPSARPKPSPSLTSSPSGACTAPTRPAVSSSPGRRIRSTDGPSPWSDPSPGLGEHNGDGGLDRPASLRLGAAPAALPLAGIRVVDFTAFWAGPAATQMLAALGAEVIKVESIQRPDGMRFTSSKPPERGPLVGVERGLPSRQRQQAGHHPRPLPGRRAASWSSS